MRRFELIEASAFRAYCGVTHVDLIARTPAGNYHGTLVAPSRPDWNGVIATVRAEHIKGDA